VGNLVAHEASQGGSGGMMGHVSRKKNGAMASGNGNTLSIGRLQITDDVAARDCIE
jgi:hypothetical protein